MRSFRARRRGELLVQSLMDRLSRPTDFELVDGYVIVKSASADERAEIVTINIIRRRLRVLDTIQVRCFGLEIWLPLLARLRLRRAVRCVMAEETQRALAAR